MDLLKVPGAKLVHIPNASEELIDRYECHDLRIEPDPQQMKSVLASANLVVHQAGAGMTAICLLAGVPQVLVPTQLEQRMMCTKLISQGLAMGVDPDISRPLYEATITNALSDQSLAVTTQNLAKKYYGFDQKDQCEAMALAINDILDAQ